MIDLCLKFILLVNDTVLSVAFFAEIYVGFIAKYL